MGIDKMTLLIRKVSVRAIYFDLLAGYLASQVIGTLQV